MGNPDESDFWRRPRRARRGVVVWASLGTAGVVAGGVVVGTMAGGSSTDGVPMADAAPPSRVADRPLSEASARPTPTTSPTGSPTPSPSEKPADKSSIEPPERDRETKAPRKTKAAEPETSAPKGGGSSGPEARVVEIVNARRAENGCGPLKANSRLARAAEGHSADMAARNYFSHTSQDGRSPGDRITAAGYRWRAYGENIAKGQQSPESVMRSWMNSPGHRRNILNCDFTEIGVGMVASGGPYWTQAFGTPR